jgi:hypothetical protein
MARYSSFLGASVEVQYRAGDILLPASGTFVGDSGRSIFLEQNFEQRGQHRHFRWEIPYQYIVRLAKKDSSAMVADAANSMPPPETLKPHLESVRKDDVEVESHQEPKRAVTAAAGAGANVTLVYPRSDPTE